MSKRPTKGTNKKPAGKNGGGFVIDRHLIDWCLVWALRSVWRYQQMPTPFLKPRGAAAKSEPQKSLRSRQGRR